MPDSRRQRIAFVITELEVGGAEKCLANLAVGLDRKHFEPTVITLAARPANGSLVARLESASIPVCFLGLSHWWDFPAGVRALRAQLTSIRADTVQSFLFHANILSALAIQRTAVRRWLAGARVADPRRSRMFLEKRLLRRANQVVCVSQSVANHYRAAGLAEDRIVVVPNGIELTNAEQNIPISNLAELGILSGRRAILFVGRLDRQKGLDFLFAAAPRVLHSLPDFDVLLVGEGPERRTLEKQAAGLGEFAPRIHFAGWRSDVPALMSACDLLVLPSRWEGMPNALLEAMAAGKAVVASRVEGVEELLGPLAAAQTVEPGNVDLLADALVQIAGNAQLRESLGESNRLRVAAEFSLSKMVQQYEALYAENTLEVS